MNKNRQIKVDTISEIKEKIEKSSSVVVWEYLGLTVKETENMKTKLAEVGASTKVYKNRIAKIAFKEAGYENIAEHLTGPSSFAFANEDETGAARVIKELVKDKDFVNFKTGIFENKVVNQEELTKIASLPDRNGLYSMFLSVMQGSIRNLMYGLKAVADKKEAEEK